MMMCSLPAPLTGVCMRPQSVVHANTHTHALLYILVSLVLVQSAAGECGFYANERRVERSQEMREHAGINLHFMITHNQSDLWTFSSSPVLPTSLSPPVFCAFFSRLLRFSLFFLCLFAKPTWHFPSSIFPLSLVSLLFIQKLSSHSFPFPPLSSPLPTLLCKN